MAQRRKALLDAYVDEAIRRGDQSPGYTRADVVQWLSRLARPGAPVVASRLGLGLVRIPGSVPRDAAVKVAGPVMTFVTLAGAAILLQHAGAAVAVVAAAAALSAVFLWRPTGGRRAGDAMKIRQRGLLGLCSAVVLVGAALSAVALAATDGLSTLVGLLPRAPLGRDDSGSPTWAIDWVSVLAGFLILAVCLGFVWAVAITVSAYRSSNRAAPPPARVSGPGRARNPCRDRRFGRGGIRTWDELSRPAGSTLRVHVHHLLQLAFFAVGGGRHRNRRRLGKRLSR